MINDGGDNNTDNASNREFNRKAKCQDQDAQIQPYRVGKTEILSETQPWQPWDAACQLADETAQNNSCQY